MSLIAVKPPRTLRLERPPARPLVPARTVETPSDGKLPATSPDRPWDRVTLYAVPKADLRFHEDAESLRTPLPDGAPDGSDLIGTLVIYAVEVLLGHRPAKALRHWLVPDVFAPLARRAGLAYRINGRAPRTRAPRILQLLTNRNSARAIEAVAAVHDGQKVRAACLRLEFLRGRWRVVALEIG